MSNFQKYKTLIESKTFWVNLLTAIVGVCMALGGQQWVSDNPQLAAWLASTVALANIVLRFVTTTQISGLFALLLCLFCCSTASAQNGLLVGNRAATLKAYFPLVDDANLQRILNDPATVLYTEAEIPKVVSMWQGVNGISRRIVAAENNADPGSLQFPWMRPAGTDDVKGLDTVRFLHLPIVNGERLPIAYFRSVIPPDSSPAAQWIYPAGTTIGEVLAMPGPDGYSYPFELRIRYKMVNYWEVDVFRPFATPAELAAAIKERRPNWMTTTALRTAIGALEGPANLGKAKIFDNQPARAIIRQEAGWDIVPDLQDPKLVGELLRGTVWTSVYGTVWKSDGKLEAYAPGSQAAFNIVPAGYSGTTLKVDAFSCARCHENTLHHVNEFAQHQTRYADGTQRFWYGRIRGSDGIFSFHPFDPARIPGGGQTVPPTLRQSLVQAGVVALYDPRRHPESLYTLVTEYDPRYRATSNPMRVVTGGN